jgi:membrane-bound ClpP family serine protease
MLDQIPFDLMLETSGGGTDATESLVSLIKNLAMDLRVLVVNAAKSNGTLPGLAACSIVMGPQVAIGTSRTIGSRHSLHDLGRAEDRERELPPAYVLESSRCSKRGRLCALCLRAE